MDFSKILNKGEPNRSQSSPSAAPPVPRHNNLHNQPMRSVTTVGPHHVPSPIASHPPPITRQHSLPSYPGPNTPHGQYPPQPPYPHSSYAPHREEYFRDPSQSVSPKTMPGQLPRDSSHDPYSAPNPNFHHELTRHDNTPTLTPSRSHNRENSIHSIISTHSSNPRDPHSAVEHPSHSPRFPHPASITSSPVQSRAPEHFNKYPSQSPHDLRPTQFRHPTQSPIQTKGMPPPITSTPQRASPPPLPHTPLAHTPAQQSPVMQNLSRQGSMAPPVGLASEMQSDHSRKRSLDTVGLSPRLPKRARYDCTPAWAQRIQWKPHREMEQWDAKKWLARDRSHHAEKPKNLTAESTPLMERRGVADPKSARIPMQVQHHAEPPSQINGANQHRSSRSFEVVEVGDYELSLDNQVPYNDVNREVMDFLFDNVILAPDLGPGAMEVEARLGCLIDPNTDRRLNLGTTTEAVLGEGMKPRFKSMMSEEQHREFNEYLNNETVRAKNEPNRKKIQYAHTRDMDTFYEAPQDFLDSLPPPLLTLMEGQRWKPRVRVTIDDKTKQFKEAIVKIRIRDLEISCPRQAFDVRISISCEMQYTGSIDNLVQSVRKPGDTDSRYKDRLAYKHQFVSVDLTQVRVDKEPGNKLHELELEMDTEVLKREGEKVRRGDANNYEGIVGIFMNYVRVINRSCRLEVPPGF